MWYRLLAAGYECHYDPAVVVHHYHRASLADLRYQLRMYTRGHVTALLAQWQRHGDWGNIRRVLLAMPAYYARLLVRDTLQGFRGPGSMLPPQASGAVAGIGYYFSHRGGHALPTIAPRSVS